MLSFHFNRVQRYAILFNFRNHLTYGFNSLFSFRKIKYSIISQRLAEVAEPAYRLGMLVDLPTGRQVRTNGYD